jgi:hypothetical protein
MNNLSSSIAVYNELVDSHPELLELLFRGFHYNIRGNGPLGDYRDITLLNNYTVHHNRDEFVDFDKPEEKRLLLRQWINLDGARELTWDFADHYNTGPRTPENAGERRRTGKIIEALDGVYFIFV